MAVFQDIKLTWKDQEKTIKANNVAALIADLEDIISLKRLVKNRDDLPLMKLSQAYAFALRYAGFSVEAEEIYQLCFMKGEAVIAIENAVSGLLMMFIPPPSLMPRLEAQAKKPRPKAKPSR